MNTLLLLPVVCLSYLLGSFPSGILVARLFKKSDPRIHNSGHTGGLNSARGGGLVVGLLVTMLDLSKGAAAVWLAGRLSTSLMSIPLAGTFVVIGHNWPVWLRFSGGMGLATGAGAMGGQSLWVVVGALFLLGIYRLLIRHTPRAVIATMITWPTVLLFMPIPASTQLLAIGACLAIAIRHLGDWNRVYR